MHSKFVNCYLSGVFIIYNRQAQCIRSLGIISKRRDLVVGCISNTVDGIIQLNRGIYDESQKETMEAYLKKH